MDRIEKNLLKRAILVGFFEGIGGAVFAFLFVMSSGKMFFLVIVGGMFIGGLFEFFWIYRVNLKIHLKFKKKYGEKYINLVEEELGKNGISNMLKKKWFFEREKQDRNGEFMRELRALR